jgi:regulator of protease activity HflC (stomatin/prohibitin superfamily)
VNATATVFFKIINPELAVYEVDNLPESIEKVCLNALRSQVGNYRFDELFSKRVEISKAVTSELDSKVSRWG